MTDLVKQETNLPTTQMHHVESVLKSDIIIPKVLLMQGLSDFVKARKATIGDMVRSTTVQKLGDDKTPLEVIPLTFQNLWMISEDQKGDGKKYEFRRYETRNAGNETLDWDFKENGTNWKRTKVMHLFALLPGDIMAQQAALDEFKKTGELPDVESALLPVVIPFRSMSYKYAAKTVSTFFAKAQSLSEQMGVVIPPYASTLKLFCRNETNEHGDFFVFMVEGAGKTQKEYREAAAAWYKTLTSGANVKIDDSDVVAEETASTDAGF